MAYVPGFVYDQFIRYSSDDFDDTLKGLLDELTVYLRRELGNHSDSMEGKAERFSKIRRNPGSDSHPKLRYLN